jgi:hypothetical protein
MGKIDKTKLIGNRVRGVTDTHLIEGVGEVRFRGMSRTELLHASDVADKDGILAAERYTLSTCMVDPVLTEDEVRGWQEGSPGTEINDIAMKINALSGVKKGADKSVVSDVPGPA